MKHSHFLFFLFLLIPAVDAGEQWAIDPSARVVLGQSDFTSNAAGSGSSGISRPFDAVADPATGKVFVVDFLNHRVLRFPAFSALFNGSPAEAVLGQPDFETVTSGLSATKMNYPYQATVDNGGRLWVVDKGNARVLRFENASSIPSGSPADGVLCQGALNTVQFETSRSRMRLPFGVAVDDFGTLYVSDFLDHRVLVFAGAAFLGNGVDASAVLGQPNFTSADARTTRDGMSFPRGLALDSAGNLYVADSLNNRVIRFDEAHLKASGANCDSVIGQINFVSNVSGLAANRFNAPWDLAVDSVDRLWVADLGNNRILGFSDPAVNLVLPAAEFVLGQADFESAELGTTDRRFTRALYEGGLIDAGLGVGTDASGRVWVADTGNNRILAFTEDAFQPDFRIGKTAAADRGKNLYNTHGGGQTQAVKITNQRKVKLTGKIENDGNVTDTFQVRGAKSTSRFQISVFLKTGGKRNITGSVVAGSYVSDSVAPGGALTFEHEIKPKGKFKSKRRSIRAWLQATSQSDGETDRVVSFVKNRPKK